jgi:hypothetical protein
MSDWLDERIAALNAREEGMSRFFQELVRGMAVSFERYGAAKKGAWARIVTLTGEGDSRTVTVVEHGEEIHRIVLAFEPYAPAVQVSEQIRKRIEEGDDWQQDISLRFIPAVSPQQIPSDGSLLMAVVSRPEDFGKPVVSVDDVIARIVRFALFDDAIKFEKLAP